MFVHMSASQFGQQVPRTQSLPAIPRQPRPTLPKPQPPSAMATSLKFYPSAQEGVRIRRPIASNSRVKSDTYKSDMYLVFVNNALLQMRQGNAGPFNELVTQFNFIDPDAVASSRQLRMWLSALSQVASQLGRPYASLIDAVIAMPWATMDAALAKAYVSCMGIIVSARPEYLHAILQRTAQGLTYQSGLRTRDGESLTKRELYDRLHTLLGELLRLFPTLPPVLQPLLVENFPHKRQNRIAHVTYIKNLLQIVDYCPELRDAILSTIIERTIQIDVEIQVEIEELETQGNAEAAEIFEFDPFDSVVGQDGTDSGSQSGEDEEDNLSDISSAAEALDADIAQPIVDEEGKDAYVKETVVKLDAMLKLIFTHLDLSASSARMSKIHVLMDSGDCTSPAEQAESLRRAQLHTRQSQSTALIKIFDRTILHTFKSRYTQFLIFWYASQDSAFCDCLQGLLVHKALVDDADDLVTRVAAASYLASFVSRALFVGPEVTRKVVCLLCDALANHLDVADEAELLPHTTQDSGQHVVFYAVAQAAFLIFCYRWRDLLENSDDAGADGDELDAGSQRSCGAARRRWIPQLDILQRAINSPLNPLQVCSGNVVQQFARVSRHVGFVYCTRGALTGAAPRGTAMHAELHTFFPFDPCRLPHAARFVDPVYRDWARVAISDDEDDEDDEDNDDDEGEEGEDAEDMLSAQLGQSLSGMSISPLRALPATRR